MTETRTAFRTCPLCEATCGLELTLEGDLLTKVRGDDADVFSHGYICPKGVALTDLENDPDIIRTPLVRRDGELQEATWAEAFDAVEAGLRGVMESGGRDAVALYLGNPNVHNLSGQLYIRPLITALGTHNIYSAATVDQMPKQLASGLMFGSGALIAVPDVDRTDHLVILGANPFASNGSLLTAADLPGRLRALRKRGGKMVVIDPVHTATAKEADEHHYIVPGTDAHLLFGIVNVLFADSLVKLGDLEPHIEGVDDIFVLAQPFTPEAVAAVCGIAAPEIRRIAHELASAEKAAVYARIGTCTQEYGTLASWLVDVINVLIGSLDRPGGAMFTTPAAAGPTTWGTPGSGHGTRYGRHKSRVRGLSEIMGELPVVCMAEEMLTPGEGQVKALITIAGNPVVSTPDAQQLDRALDGLEFMVSVDIYLNETTRHCDVFLPGQSVLTRSHYDIAFGLLMCRNVANYSPPVVQRPDGALNEWEVLLRLTAIASGMGARDDTEMVDALIGQEVLRRGLSSPGLPAHGVDQEEAWGQVAHRRGPERLLDIMLRTGPYGEAFGRNPDGLSLDVLASNPHGMDFGPLVPRIPEALRTPTGKIELAPEPLVNDTERLRASLENRSNGHLVLVGRRHLRSNNSWMHNLPILKGGSNRCTLLIHPDDAGRLGVEDGKPVVVGSSAGSIEVFAEVTEGIMPGVVSLPHGWGQGGDGVKASVAAGTPRANSNVLAPADLIDPLSGNAVLNGIPVTVSSS